MVEFPFRNKFSIFVGIMRVYPAMESYLEQMGYEEAPVMEIYDVPNKKIIYIMEIRR